MVGVRVSWSSRAISQSLVSYFPSLSGHAGSGRSHNGYTGWSKRLYARVEPSGNFKRVSVPLLNTSGWLSWSRNSDKSSRYHTVQRKSKTDRKAEEGADKCITKVTETFELKRVAEGNIRFRTSKQTSSQPLLYALMSGINLCKSQSSRQWEILIQHARIYRAWLPSEIYSLLLSPILDNTIFRNDFRGQPRAVNSGELHGNLILC